jgi:hypothetical protein
MEPISYSIFSDSLISLKGILSDTKNLENVRNFAVNFYIAVRRESLSKSSIFKVYIVFLFKRNSLVHALFSSLITERRVRRHVVNKECKRVSKPGALAILYLSEGTETKTSVTIARVGA